MRRGGWTTRSTTRAFWWTGASESEVLNRIFEVWFREYSLTQRIVTEETRHVWYWDSFVHVDPLKESNSQRVRLENNTTTLAAECARDGKDYLSVIHQRAKEIKLMRELGIPIQNDPPQQEEKTEPDDDGSEPKEVMDE